jgi:hypothetical protein
MYGSSLLTQVNTGSIKMPKNEMDMISMYSNVLGLYKATALGLWKVWKPKMAQILARHIYEDWKIDAFTNYHNGR